MVAVIYSDEFLDHKTGKLHPEKPERLSAIALALQKSVFAERLTWQKPTPVTQARVMRLINSIHSPSHVKDIEYLAQRGGGYVDSDTIVSPRSYDVALLAVSAWLDGVERVIATNDPAFVLARPPGHHAERDRARGCCLFSTAAIAAHYALEQPGITRVAILDWDVHHGNGTQAIVERHPCIAFCSLHQSPCYPGTGAAAEQGLYKNVLNLPVAPGSTMAVYQPLFVSKVIPFLADFQPDLLIVSAGYDANAADPLAEMALQPQDYGVFATHCLQLTRKIVFGLEGGYDFSALSQSVVATIQQCLI